MSKKETTKNRIQTLLLLILPPLLLCGAVLAVLLLWKEHDGSGQALEENTPEPLNLSLAETETESEGLQPKSRAETIVSAMTLEEKAAQLFFVTPEALTKVTVAAAAGDTTREAFEKWPVGGIIYDQDNLQANMQTEEMLSNMQAIALEKSGFPVLLGTEEEGGSVTCIAGYSDFGVTDVGAMGSFSTAGEAKDAGKTIASYLKELGFNMDFAPVADVADGSANSVIGDRAFSGDAAGVSELVSAAVEGFREEGVLTVLKHFPGYGSTEGDYSIDYAYNNKTEEELKASDFLPFEAGIRSGADMVMVGHISLPNVLTDDTPASLSSTVITDFLRNYLGFTGVVITDSMSLGAVSNHYTSAESAVKAIQAGADMILMPPDFEEAYEGILSAVSEGTITEERIDQSVKRILDMKLRIAES